MSPLASPTVVLTERSTIRETVIASGSTAASLTDSPAQLSWHIRTDVASDVHITPSSQSCDGGDVVLSDAKGVEQPRDRDDVALPEPQ